MTDSYEYPYDHPFCEPDGRCHHGHCEECEEPEGWCLCDELRDEPSTVCEWADRHRSSVRRPNRHVTTSSPMWYAEEEGIAHANQR
jgi:hypothetical protein